jgi:hypothetical protein
MHGTKILKTVVLKSTQYSIVNISIVQKFSYLVQDSFKPRLDFSLNSANWASENILLFE